MHNVISESDEPRMPGVPQYYAHILVALDGSAAAEQVIPYVEALARRFGSDITLLRAVTPIEADLMGEAMVGSLIRPASSAETVDRLQYNAIAYLKAVQDRLRGDGLNCQVDLPEGNHAEAIVERARELRADLIAMTTHGYGGLKRAILGSVADEVIRKAHCPILLIRLTE